jgi:hypothetical protein
MFLSLSTECRFQPLVFGLLPREDGHCLAQNSVTPKLADLRETLCRLLITID